jgi:predicted cobalt transporter CbtA
MKIIPRKMHGLLDYLVGVVLIAAPWLFGFADDGPATYIPVALGAGALVYSILTNYEFGVVRLIPFRVHLLLDVLLEHSWRSPRGCLDSRTKCIFLI